MFVLPIKLINKSVEIFTEIFGEGKFFINFPTNINIVISIIVKFNVHADLDQFL